MTPLQIEIIGWFVVVGLGAMAAILIFVAFAFLSSLFDD